MEKPILILKTGTSYPNLISEFGDFDKWTLDGLGLESSEKAIVIDVEHGEIPPSPNDVAGVLVTGSHAMVTDPDPWIVHATEWVAEAVLQEIPVFGLCFGHQLLARAMGGRVDYHPWGHEVGTVAVRVHESAQNDPLFADLPSTIAVHAVHAQTVLELPEGAILLASNAFEKSHAFRVGPCAWGVQFHPEYTVAIMRAYVESEVDTLLKGGYTPTAVRDAVRKTPDSSALLVRFKNYCLKKCACPA
jgi:GMP synthase (glutamine-hydrolysing)